MIPFLDLQAHHRADATRFHDIFDAIVTSSAFVDGDFHPTPNGALPTDTVAGLARS